MNNFKNIFHLVCFFILFFIHNILWSNIDPALKLNMSVEKVIDILYDDQRYSNLNKIEIEDAILEFLSSQYELDIIIRRTLGRNWNKIESEHQEKIMYLIKRLVVRAYVDGMLGQRIPNIKNSNTIYISEKRAEVPQIIDFGNINISIIYRFGLIDDMWQIFDIVIEDMSIVVNYRDQFDAYFNKNNSLDLINDIETLLRDDNLGKALPIK